MLIYVPVLIPRCHVTLFQSAKSTLWDFQVKKLLVTYHRPFQSIQIASVATFMGSTRCTLLTACLMILFSAGSFLW